MDELKDLDALLIRYYPELVLTDEKLAALRCTLRPAAAGDIIASPALRVRGYLQPGELDACWAAYSMPCASIQRGWMVVSHRSSNLPCAFSLNSRSKSSSRNGLRSRDRYELSSKWM